MSEECEEEPDYSETFTQEPGEVDDEPVPRPLRPEWAIVAHAWADPTSPTYQDKSESYWVGYPIPVEQRTDERKRENARRNFYRLLERQAFRDEVERIRLQIRGAVGLTKEDYIKLLLRREHMFATRAGKGDAQAAAATLKLIGEATGLLVKRREDMTPPERRLPPGGPEATAAMIAAFERMKRLQESIAPKHALAAAEELPVKVIDPNRCFHCDGRRQAHYLGDTHWSGKPTCRICDEVLGAEKRRRERDLREQSAEGGSAHDGGARQSDPDHPREAGA